MKRIIYTVFIIAAGFAFLNNAGGRASAGNQGNTGAPGDAPGTCANCHGQSIEVDLNIEVYNENDEMVSMYQPGETYRVVVSLETEDPSAIAYGFQMTSIIDSSEEDVQTWANPSDNAQLANARGRQYVEHNGPSQEATFEAEWTAPETDLGSISFYAAGNAVNRNSSTSGDGSANNQLTLMPAMTSNVEASRDLSIYRVFANPVVDQVTYQVPQGRYDIRIYNTEGRMVFRSQQHGERLSWNKQDMTSGINYIHVLSEEGNYADRLIVK